MRPTDDRGSGRHPPLRVTRGRLEPFIPGNFNRPFQTPPGELNPRSAPIGTRPGRFPKRGSAGGFSRIEEDGLTRVPAQARDLPKARSRKLKAIRDTPSAFAQLAREAP